MRQTKVILSHILARVHEGGEKKRAKRRKRRKKTEEEESKDQGMLS